MYRGFAYLLICIVGLSGLTAIWVDPVVAQTSESTVPDYDAWGQVVTRAQDAIDVNRASDQALSGLREELSGWRQVFESAQDGNQLRQNTVQDQLTALGPVPESGDEPAEIADRRTQLNAQLLDMRVPLVQAQEAFQQASGLIDELDATLRARQADALMRLGPSPLNPTYWPAAVETASLIGSSLRHDIVAEISSTNERRALRDQLPLILLLLLISAVLISRGNTWAERAAIAVHNMRERPLSRLISFVLSAGQVVLPYLGVLAFVHAVSHSGIAGFRFSSIIAALPAATFAYLIARWLGIRIFPRIHMDHPFLELSDAQAAQGRWSSATLGISLGISILLDSISTGFNLAQESLLVPRFILQLIAAVALIRIGQLLRIHFAAGTEDQQFRWRIKRGSAVLVVAIALIGALLSAIGYMTSGETLIFSTAMSLALIAFLQIVHRLITVVFALVSESDQDGESLISVFVRFLFSLASLPIFALIWGVRVSKLQEWWQGFIDGISIGDVHISPADFVTFAVLFSVGYIATRLIQGSLRNSVLPKTRLDAGGRNAVIAGTGYTGIFLSAVVAITGAGIDLSSLAIVAGALSVGIGFGLQTIVSNFVSGIILLIERPISEGDWIEVAGQAGYVRDISVRSTRIETFDQADLIVPNADLISGMVKNVTKGDKIGRVIVPVGVAYGTDSRRVEQILMEIAEAHPLVVLNPEPAVIFRGLGASSLDFEIRAYLKDVNWIMTVLSDMNHEIVRRFDEEGIAIPFPQQDVWLHMAEASKLTADAQAGQKTATAPGHLSKSTRDSSDTGTDGGTE